MMRPFPVTLPVRITRAGLAIVLTMGVAVTGRAQTDDGGDTEPPTQTQPTGEAEPDDEDNQRAQELYDNGARLYQEGYYAEAIDAFEAGWELSEAPLFLYNIASAYERMGDVDRALSYLNRYRAFARPEEQEVLNRRIRNLEHRIVEAPDPIPPTEVAATEAEFTETEVVAPPEDDDGGLGAGHWTLIGLTIAGVVSATTFGILAKNNRDAYESACEGEGALCPGSSRQDFDDWERNALIADISWGIAAASGVTLILVLLLERDEPADSGVSVRPSVSPLGASLFVGGSF